MKKIILVLLISIWMAGPISANPLPPARVEYVNAFPPEIGIMFLMDSLNIAGDTIITTSGAAIIGQYDPPGPDEMVIFDSSNTTGFVINSEGEIITISTIYCYERFGTYWWAPAPIKGHPIRLIWVNPFRNEGGWHDWSYDFTHTDWGWTDIVINEINANCDWNPESNFIELYNQSDSSIDLGGWKIICDTIFEIPQNVVIRGNGFYVLDESDFPDIFDMDYDADNIYLVRGDTIVDQVGWSSNHGANVSYMRFPDGDVDTTNSRQGYMGYNNSSSYTFENGYPSRGAPNRHDSPGFVVIGTHASGDTGVVEIGWTNPVWFPTYDYSVVVGNFNHFPQNPSDGYIAYQGEEQQATDIGLPGNTVIHYTIFARDINGNYSVPTDESRVFVIMGIVGVNEEDILPQNISSLECYPNPFNASVKIDFVLNQEERASLSIYNIRGQKVLTLFDGTKSAGKHRITWNGSDHPSGVYFARLQAGSVSKSVKMLLLK